VQCQRPLLYFPLFFLNYFPFLENILSARALPESYWRLILFKLHTVLEDIIAKHSLYIFMKIEYAFFMTLPVCSSLAHVPLVPSSRSICRFYRSPCLFVFFVAPGKVSQFKIDYHPDGDYSKLTVSWKMPTILERNGIIKSYNFEYFETTVR
jgi:hypothetical protein